MFCDWRHEMNIIAEALEARGLREPVVFHGGMDVMERDCATSRFMDEGEDSPRVMLLQTACGACGLNLQAASRVYVLRPQWNPAVELQAIGRAHRSGQKRDVEVMRLVARGTVDERALRTQREKLTKISEVIDDTMQKRLDGGGVLEENEGKGEAPADNVGAPADNVGAPADSVDARADNVEAPADNDEAQEGDDDCDFLDRHFCEDEGDEEDEEDAEDEGYEGFKEDAEDAEDEGDEKAI